ncbi:MAG: esterase [Methylibium sp. NZG]|nr:MAG: esterase [Methylibium sp. NZG]
MTRPDPTWLDAQYNNRARVADAAQILERWARASALAREKSDARLDLPYGDGDKETLDVFPAARENAPVLVFIHGGYWRALDKSDASFVAPSFVQAGAMVVVPNYALCPAVSVDHIALQMARSLAWVYRNARRHGGDPSRIVVAGHSAGGQLAAMMLSCQWQQVGADLPARLVRGALSISGVFDLEPLRHTPFLKHDLKLTPASVRRLSPVGFPPPEGPLYATVGAEESEEFLRQNELIRSAWGARTVPVCEAIPHTNHMNVLHDLADPQGRLHLLGLQLLGLPSVQANQ